MREIKVDIYSHFFKIEDLEEQYQPIINSFVKDNLLEIKTEFENGRVRQVPGMVFATRSSDHREFRFHIGTWDKFKADMDIRKIDLKIVDHRETVHAGVDTVFTVPKGKELRDYQKDIIEKLDQNKSPTFMIELAMGLGKGMPLDTRVRVPNGYKRLGDLTVGEIVSVPNGDKAKVKGAYDNKDMPCHRITFVDGREVVCDEEHLWDIYDPHDRVWNTMKMSEIIEIFHKRKRFSDYVDLRIPLVDPTDSADEEVELPLDPYEKGLELGNCSDKNNGIIPNVYLESSFRQRAALLKGLLLSRSGSRYYANSWCRGYGKSEFRTTSEELAKQVQWLMRSLGMVVTLKERRNTFRVIPNKKHVTKLRIKNIEPVGKLDTRCIQVDHPDELFIVEDFVCTHNTFLALSHAAKTKKRVCIFVLGRYTDRWWGDLESYAKRDEILEIRGSKELLRTLEFCGTEIFESTKIIIMTLDTFNDYCREWERMTHEERKNNVPPEDIWEILGVGLRITDEVHQHFYKNFLIDLYTHLPKTIYLSATLKPESRFVEAMTRVMFPMECRAGKGLQKKYTNVTAVFHGTNEPWKLKYKNGKGMYSHTRYEKYLMSNKKVCANYYGLVDKIVKEDYVDKKDKGQKMLIFFATKAMCDDYAKHLKKTFPKLDSRRYISEDKYENLLKADIACSTLGSSGTAVDIPNLKIALMTTALKSEQANLQALGRTREIPGVQTEFKYFVNTSIDKHKQYHYDKVKLFRDWAKEQKVQMSDVFI